MDVEYLLTATRSARKTLDLEAPVDMTDIRECLRIGLQAANGSNQQSWRWLVVTDPALRHEIAELYRAALYGSIFPAVWNFQLALHTRGYGTCITTLHLHREEEVRRLLGIPETYVQGCLLPVGRIRAGHTFRPARRLPVGEVVTRDRWGGPPL